MNGLAFPGIDENQLSIFQSFLYVSPSLAVYTLFMLRYSLETVQLPKNTTEHPPVRSWIKLYQTKNKFSIEIIFVSSPLVPAQPIVPSS